MSPSEILDHPALVALLGTAAVFGLCFLVTWCYGAIKGVRTLKILFHMEKLGCRRSPCGTWTWSRMVEVLRAADGMPTLGSAKMDATRQKLREQADSPVLGWLTAVLALLLAVMIVLAAIVAGRAIVALALLPGVMVLLALHCVVKRADKSWRIGLEPQRAGEAGEDGRVVLEPQRAGEIGVDGRVVFEPQRAGEAGEDGRVVLEPQRAGEAGEDGRVVFEPQRAGEVGEDGRVVFEPQRAGEVGEDGRVVFEPQRAGEVEKQ